MLVTLLNIFIFSLGITLFHKIYFNQIISFYAYWGYWLLTYVLLQCGSLVGIRSDFIWFGVVSIVLLTNLYFVLRDSKADDILDYVKEAWHKGRRAPISSHLIIIFVLLSSVLIYLRGPIYWDEFFSWSRFPKIVHHDQGFLDNITQGFHSYVQFVPYMSGVLQFGGTYDLAIPGFLTWIFVNSIATKVSNFRPIYFLVVISMLWIQSSVFMSSYLDGALAISIVLLSKNLIEFFNNKAGLFQTAISALIVSLIKPVGTALVVVVLIASAFVLVWYNKGDMPAFRKNILKVTGVVILTLLLTVSLQFMKQNKYERIVPDKTHETSISKLSKLADLTPYDRDLLSDIIGAMIKNESNSKRSFYLYVAAIIIVLLTFKSERGAVQFFLVSLIASIGNWLLLVVAYLVKFVEYEARYAASSDRYMLHTLFGIVIAMLMVINERFRLHFEKRYVILFLAIMTASSFIYIIHKNGKLPKEQKEILSSNKYCTERESRTVQVITQHDQGFLQLLAGTGLAPQKKTHGIFSIGKKKDVGDVWTHDKIQNFQEWKELLIRDKIDEVLIVQTNEFFVKNIWPAKLGIPQKMSCWPLAAIVN